MYTCAPEFAFVTSFPNCSPTEFEAIVNVCVLSLPKFSGVRFVLEHSSDFISRDFHA